MSEIFTLTWSNVNLSNRLAVFTHTNAKSSKARALVLNEQAMQLIGSLSCDSDYVFTRETHKRIYDIDRCDFKRALQLSLIDNFHDFEAYENKLACSTRNSFFTLKAMEGLGVIKDRSENMFILTLITSLILLITSYL